jgi:hypothetical protein
MTWLKYAGLMATISGMCLAAARYDELTGIPTALLGEGPGSAMAWTLVVLAPIGAIVVIVKCPPGDMPDVGRWLRRILFPAPQRARRRK